MLLVSIKGQRLWDERKEEFITLSPAVFEIEHSLVAVKKWESIYKKPFFGKEEKSPEDILNYIRCMTVTKNVDQSVYNYIPMENLKQILEYIGDSMTATWFSKQTEQKTGKKEIITSEIIYYWMITLQIPLECENWHLNQLFTLIRVFAVKNGKDTKMSKKDAANYREMINAANRKKFKSKG